MSSRISRSGVQKPTKNVVVSPKMLAAGARILAPLDPPSAYQLAAEVYRAMAAVAPPLRQRSIPATMLDALERLGHKVDRT